MVLAFCGSAAVGAASHRALGPASCQAQPRLTATAKRRYGVWALRLSCTGESSEYLASLNRNRPQEGESTDSGPPPQSQLSYLEKLEQQRLKSPAGDASGATPPPAGGAAPGTVGTGGWWARLCAFLGLSPKTTQTRQSRLAQLRAYGVAAIIAYGMFDAVTYSLSFVIALAGFKRATNNAPLTWQNLLKVVGGMWLLNNFSRPFRVAGALLLAPVVDRHIVKPIGRAIANRRQAKRTS